MMRNSGLHFGMSLNFIIEYKVTRTIILVVYTTQTLSNLLQLNHFIIIIFRDVIMYNHLTWQSSFKELILQTHSYIQKIIHARLFIAHH